MTMGLCEACSSFLGPWTGHKETCPRHPKNVKATTEKTKITVPTYWPK